MLNVLAGNKYYSILDAKSGYNQIECAEEHLSYCLNNRFSGSLKEWVKLILTFAYYVSAIWDVIQHHSLNSLKQTYKI